MKTYKNYIDSKQENMTNAELEVENIIEKENKSYSKDIRTFISARIKLIANRLHIARQGER